MACTSAAARSVPVTGGTTTTGRGASSGARSTATRCASSSTVSAGPTTATTRVRGSMSTSASEASICQTSAYRSPPRSRRIQAAGRPRRRSTARSAASRLGSGAGVWTAAPPRGSGIDGEGSTSPDDRTGSGVWSWASSSATSPRASAWEPGRSSSTPTGVASTSMACTAGSVSVNCSTTDQAVSAAIGSRISPAGSSPAQAGSAACRPESSAVGPASARSCSSRAVNSGRTPSGPVGAAESLASETGGNPVTMWDCVGTKRQ